MTEVFNVSQPSADELYVSYQTEFGEFHDEKIDIQDLYDWVSQNEFLLWDFESNGEYTTAPKTISFSFWLNHVMDWKDLENYLEQKLAA